MDLDRRAGWSSTATAAPRPCASPANTPCAAASSTCFPPGTEQPVRLDFFGDTLESIRTFDPRDPAHRSTSCARSISCRSREFQLDHRDHPPLPHRLCRDLRRRRAATTLLYEAVSEGRRHPGMEHWLPLFHERLDTLFDYLPRRAGRARAAGRGRRARAPRADRRLLRGARARRCEHAGGGALYKPLPPDRLYLTEDEWRERLDAAALARLTPFAVPEDGADVIDAGARHGRNFAAERADADVNVFDAVVAHVAGAAGAAASAWSSRCGAKARATAWPACSPTTSCTTSPVVSVLAARRRRRRSTTVALAVLGIEAGFETARRRRHQRAGHPRRPPGAAAPRAAQAPTTSSPRSTSLAAGDLVVHVDHGIGRFVGLKTHRGGRRAARLPRDPLRRRRQAVPAGREHRAAVALRLGGHRGRARPARRRRLAGAQGAS